MQDEQAAAGPMAADAAASKDEPERAVPAAVEREAELPAAQWVARLLAEMAEPLPQGDGLALETTAAGATALTGRERPVEQRRQTIHPRRRQEPQAQQRERLSPPGAAPAVAAPRWVPVWGGPALPQLLPAEPPRPLIRHRRSQRSRGRDPKSRPRGRAAS
jgi:hypothetical protein